MTEMRALLSSGRPRSPRGPPPTCRSITLDDRSSSPPASPPGLFAQIRATRDAAWGLATAHLELAKAEAKAIGGQLARVAALIGLAIAVLISAAILLLVGGSLFLGEWLLGSIGWGVLHGLLLFVAIAVACSLAAVGVSGGRIGRAFILGLIVAVVVAVVLAVALPNRLYTTAGDQVLPNIEPRVRPLLVGIAVWAVIGFLGGLLGMLRVRGAGARLGSLISATAVGATFGAISAVDVGAQVGVGIGIAVGYLTWIGLMGADVARTGVDLDALKARFYPTQTIETSKETLEWLKNKLPPGTGS